MPCCPSPSPSPRVDTWKEVCCNSTFQQTDLNLKFSISRSDWGLQYLTLLLSTPHFSSFLFRRPRQGKEIKVAMDRQRSNNPNRLRSLLLTSPSSSSSPSSPFELHESDLFASSPDRSHAPTRPLLSDSNSDPNSTNYPIPFSRRSAFPRSPQGILAALPSSSLSSSPSSSSSSPSSARMIPPIPKPSPSFPQVPQYQSAPVNVPVLPSRFKNKKSSILHEEEEEKSDEDEMLPPHEIIDRARAKESPMTTFSVLEGAGRTLKGRDLRQVRNAVWRKTGFLD